MRQLIQRYGWAIVVVLLVLVVGVVALYMRSGPKPVAPSGVKAFYIDEETGDESTRSVTDNPPLIGKDGKPTVVQAYKFTRDGGKTVTIGYLMKYTPEGKEAMDKMNATGQQPDMLMNEQRLVRSPEKGSEWYPMTSSQGEAVMGAVQMKGEGGRLEMVNAK